MSDYGGKKGQKSNLNYMLPVTVYFKYKETNNLNECLCFPIPETTTYSIFISGQLHDHNGVHKAYTSGSWRLFSPSK